MTSTERTHEPAGALRATSLSVWRQEHAKPARQVLGDVCFSIRPGERVAVVGPNGAGKTTLLWALIGATPSEGRVEIAGHLASPSTLDQLRRDVGFVFADPGDQLFLPSVAEEVAFGPEQRGWSRHEIDERVAVALELVGLSGFEARASSELSLGEQRRLAVATVLSTAPRVLLLDEPTASLDPRARAAMLQAIGSASATVLFATHDLEAVLEVGARVLLLREGRLMADGPAHGVLSDAALMDASGLEVPLSLRLTTGS